MKNFRKAFSLTELMVVIVILSILATVGFMYYTKYLLSARDSTRIEQMNKTVQNFQSYALGKKLPFPENSVEILSSGKSVGKQGKLGKEILDTMGLPEYKDPKDKTYYSYLLTSNRKFFQFVAFMELPQNQKVSLSQVYAGQDVRYPRTFGNDLGILVETNTNIPLEDKSLTGSKIDISNVGTIELTSYFSPQEYVSGNNTNFTDLGKVLVDHGKGWVIKENKYVYLGEENGTTKTTPKAHPSCYDPANLGKVGQVGWTGCEGMLIVSEAQLRAATEIPLAATTFPNSIKKKLAFLIPNVYGDFTPPMRDPTDRQIVSGGITYTFGKGTNNIFTGQVTNMSSLFYGPTGGSFNGDIGYWDVSNVTNMSKMFQSRGITGPFAQDLSSWDVSKVTDMSYMFAGDEYFNADLSSWDVSNVTNMSYMFNANFIFNQPLNSWDVSNVTNMKYMFSAASSFNQPLNSWDVSNVTDMSYMFTNAHTFNQPLNSWNVSKVTDMNFMFNSALAFNQPLNSWNVSNVTNMGSMFIGASSFNQNLSSWCVSLIASKPSNFDNTTPAWNPKTGRQPVWGTCP